MPARRRLDPSIPRTRSILRFQDAAGGLADWRSPQDRDELAWYFETFFGWKLAPTAHPACRDKGHSSPRDVAWSMFSGRDYITGSGLRMPICVLRGSRGLAGKSTLLAGVSTLEGLHGLNGVLLGGSFEQSKRIHEQSETIYERDVLFEGKLYEKPFYRLIQDPIARETRYPISGAKREVLTASRRAVRSKHPQRNRMDEVDEMAEDVFEGAQGQTMSDDDEQFPTQTALSSTWQHPKGTFAMVLERARERGWPIAEVCYRENLVENGGWLQPIQVANKKLEVSDEMFRVEYELGEPSIIGRAIDGEAVKRMWNTQWGRYTGREGERIEMACCSKTKMPDSMARDLKKRPCTDHTYAVGADWGKKRDWTIIAVYRTDVSPWWLVSWVRLGRRSWKEMLPAFEERVHLFHGAKAAHDATGLGDVNADFLNVPAEPVILVGSVRDVILNDHVRAVEHDSFLGPRIDWAYDEYRYTTNDDLRAGSDGHAPDSFVAGAICWHLRGINLGNVDLGGANAGLQIPDPLAGLR